MTQCLKRLLQFILVFLILIIGLTIESNAQVKLTSVLLGNQYSKGDSDLKALDLNLRLTFKNTSEVPVLIYKNPFYISYIRVRKPEDGIIEQSSTLSNVTSGLKSINNLNINNFVVLKRNQIYIIKLKVRLFVPYDSNKQIAGSINSGKHSLEIMVYNWDWSDSESSEKRNELRKYGEILTHSVMSEPMLFETR